jgi:hypothetical protein
MFYSNPLWNANGTTVANLTTIGSHPHDIFINTNNIIYVPNQDNGQIVFWSEGNITSTKNISTNFLNSSSIFVTTTADIYIDTFHTIGGVGKITSNSTISISLMNMCQQCWDIFIDINNNLYCSLSERHQIIAKSLNNDCSRVTIVGGTGSGGSKSTMLNDSRGIFVHTTLDLYVADCGNDRIQFFRSGKLTATTIVGNGSLNTTIPLNCPTSIVLDGNQYLYIVDSGNHRIVGSDSNGFRCLIGCFGSAGSASNQLSNPWSLSFDSNGNIYVSDQGNNRIQKFNFVINLCSKLLCNSSDAYSLCVLLTPLLSVRAHMYA